METNQPTKHIGKAFISCSLREEDRTFINGIERILKLFGVEPSGTVGMHSASASNPAQLMKENIPKADVVVIIATPRYFQKDIKTGRESYGLSEMLHVETGMAYMSDKPVIAFVKKGTSIGNFLPNITQYIELEESNEDFKSKQGLIQSLLTNAFKVVFEKRNNENVSNLWSFTKGTLAFVGGVFLLSEIFFTKDD